MRARSLGECQGLTPVNVEVAHMAAQAEFPVLFGRFVLTLIPKPGRVGTRICETRSQCPICRATIEIRFRQETILHTTPRAVGRLKWRVVLQLLLHGDFFQRLFKSPFDIRYNPTIALGFFVASGLLVLVSVFGILGGTDDRSRLLKILAGALALLAALRLAYYLGWVRLMLSLRSAVIRLKRPARFLGNCHSVTNIVSAIYTPSWHEATSALNPADPHRLVRPLGRGYLRSHYASAFGDFHYYS